MSATPPLLISAGAETVPAMLEAASRRSTPALRQSREGAPLVLSHQEVHRLATLAGRGLIALGIQPGDHVAILGNTVPEWTLADLAALSAGAVVIPVYHTNSPEECRYVLEHSGARAVFCEDEKQVEKVRAVRADCPELEHVIAFGDAEAADDVIGVARLRAIGEEVDPEALSEATSEVGRDSHATIVYTSGTTGPPKGCIITHGNMVATAKMVEDQLLVGDDERPVVFMFLPLAHVFARVVQFVTLAAGGELAFWRGYPEHLLDDLNETRPTHFPSVPRVFEKIHTAALAGLEETNPVKRAMFGWAITTGRRMRDLERHQREPGLLDLLQGYAATQLVHRKVRALFGGNLRGAIVGAAPIGREVLEFFDACGVDVFEGYGMTETCAAATLNTHAAHRLGTVGRPLPRVDLRIAGDGEVLLRGPNVSPGYFNDDPATHEAYGDDGWLRTGDLGEIDDGGFLTITGRKKDLIITSSGKNIAPSNIETLLRETRWISQAVVYGDDKPYLVALLTLDPEQLDALAERAGVDSAPAEVLGEMQAVRTVLREDVDAINRRFATIEQIKRFDVLPHDLTQADGELTPTLKVRRNVVNDRYRDRFESLYRV